MTVYGIMPYVAMSRGHRWRSSHGEVVMSDASTPAGSMNDDSAAGVGWGAEQGETLRRLRRARNLRQSELADLIGQPRTVVSNFENGSRTPRPDLITRFAQVLQVDAAELLSPMGTEGIAIPHESDLQYADRWASLAAGLQRLVAEEERYRLDRFSAQGTSTGGCRRTFPPLPMPGGNFVNSRWMSSTFWVTRTSRLMRLAILGVRSPCEFETLLDSPVRHSRHLIHLRICWDLSRSLPHFRRVRTAGYVV